MTSIKCKEHVDILVLSKQAFSSQLEGWAITGAYL